MHLREHVASLALSHFVFSRESTTFPIPLCFGEDFPFPPRFSLSLFYKRGREILSLLFKFSPSPIVQHDVGGVDDDVFDNITVQHNRSARDGTRADFFPSLTRFPSLSFFILSSSF